MHLAAQQAACNKRQQEHILQQGVLSPSESFQLSQSTTTGVVAWYVVLIQSRVTQKAQDAYQALGLVLELIQHGPHAQVLLQPLLVPLGVLLVLRYYAPLQALHVLMAACAAIKPLTQRACWRISGSHTCTYVCKQPLGDLLVLRHNAPLQALHVLMAAYAAFALSIKQQLRSTHMPAHMHNTPWRPACTPPRCASPGAPCPLGSLRSHQGCSSSQGLHKHTCMHKISLVAASEVFTNACTHA